MDWQIQARSKTCSNCGHHFSEGDTYACLLAEADDGLRRSDYCASCWENLAGSAVEAAAVISTWRGTVPPKLEPPPEPIKRTTAETLLRKYLHSTGPSEKNFCFILALILERKKLLRQRQVIREENRGAKLLVYEHPRSGESFIIEDPGLSLAELQDVHAQVVAILEQEKISAA